MKLLLTTVFAVTLGMPALAGSYDSAGTIKGKSNVQIMPVDESTLTMHLLNSHDSFDMADANHPFAGMSGNCTGGAVVRPPAADGGGVCSYKKANGDQSFVRYEVDALGADRALHGNWVMIGGTGGLAGMSGGGRFVSLTDPATGEITVTLSGAVSMP